MTFKCSIASTYLFRQSSKAMHGAAQDLVQCSAREATDFTGRGDDVAIVLIVTTKAKAFWKCFTTACKYCDWLN